jgi:hypothetical protein
MWVPRDELLALVEPACPRALVSEEALARAGAVARAAPDALSTLYFECRLGAEDTRVDFLMCVRADDGGREALLAQSRDRRGGPLWEGVFAFGEEWIHPDSPLCAGVPSLWLEFDIDAPPSEELRPFAMVCVQPSFLREPVHQWAWDAEARGNTWRLAQRALELLGRGPMRPAVSRTVLGCFEHLPPEAHMTYVGPLAARRSEAVRLVLTLRREHLEEYLARIGWPGAFSPLRELMWDRLGFPDRVELHMDVGETVLPTISFGIHFPERLEADGLRHQLAPVVEQGLCTEDKGAALLRWPGRERVTLRGHQWPSYVERGLDIKLVHHPDAPPSVKAYLSACGRFAFFG